MKVNALIMYTFLLSCLTTNIAAQDVSDEAKRYFARGVAAVEMAKSPSDYESAINEFGQAVNLAPNWPDVYYNLGLVQEKAEKYGDAIISLRQYLRLAPNASDAEDVKALIAKNEYKNEKLLKEKEKFQSVIGTWGLKENEAEGFYKSVTLTQNGEKIEYKTYTAQGLETNEVIFDGANMKFKYRMYDSFPKEWEVIVKMAAPGRFEGIINQVILDTPHNDRRFDYMKGKKTSSSLIMIKQ
jgi:tetratricopeptide (TPR) repeat protein